ncbi:alpha/beta hydrolase-fold protein [Acinetobacter sichuanensis]|uniref:alpha/beta hydrolase-fold protein n=1 Tax=Acinetobacter sichuanensis TaxID=2136183 RepID=UPI00280F30D8|nr:alpha/beta hydrolase-fold protein [Acinetobacter sichuanensis]MDQ9021269.1 alpha/beta hydrolase-fold protein [Acinetobacter sichuanensis]
MELKFHPTHSLLNQENVGSSTWWEQIKLYSNPLITHHNGNSRCSFIWKKKGNKNNILIDIYSQTPSIYQQWNLFHQLEGTDVCVYEIDLPQDWFGSYVIVETEDDPPMTNEAVLRRKWWMSQLQHFAQADPLSAHPRYSGQIACVINQLHLNPHTPSKVEKLNNLPEVQSKTWFSHRLKTQYQIDFFSTASLHHQQNQPHSLPVLLFLDGQIWSEQLPLLPFITDRTASQSIFPATFVFIHSDAAKRQHDYGCHDDFSHALVTELLPWLQQFDLRIDTQQTSIIGQSLGGLCAIHSSLLYPNFFQHVVAQSGSYWWSDLKNSPFLQSRHHQYLVNPLTKANEKSQKYLNFISKQTSQQNLFFRHCLHNSMSMTWTPTQFHISAGHCETDMYGLSQQLDLHLKQNGSHSSFHRYYGGHDPVNWHKDLLQTLNNILSSKHLSKDNKHEPATRKLSESI